MNGARAVTVYLPLKRQTSLRVGKRKEIKMKKNNPVKKIAQISDLKDLVETNAECYGDKALYYYKEGKEVLSFSHNRLKASVDGLGTAFSLIGVMGSNIAVIGDTNPYYMVTYYAAANGGGAIIPLDKELDNETIAGFLKIADAKALVYTESFNSRIPEIEALAPFIKYFIPIKPDEALMPNEKYRALVSLIEDGTKAIEDGNNTFTDFMPDREALAALIFTSGTTGTSKCVMLSHKNLATATNACCESMSQFGEDSTFVSVLPMNHSYEVTTEHLALSRIGSSTYINDSIKNALRSFNYFKPNSLLLVPLFVETIYKRIWKEIDKKGKRRSAKFGMALSGVLLKVGIDVRKKLFKDVVSALGGNLKCIVCGGAPLSKELIHDFHSFGIEILEGYGITECSPLVSVNRLGKARPGSVGTPVEGCTVKIDKQESEKTGEILVKGDNVMMGYLNNPEATAEVFTEDGWFKTGDIGYLDKDGYIYITGRKKNVIILSNGKNIFPEELEEHLYKNEIIGECVIIGRKAGSGETAITAVIFPNAELSEGKSAEEIAAAVKDAVDLTNKHLPTFKHIQAFEIRDTEFEKTTTRKIKRFLVK